MKTPLLLIGFAALLFSCSSPTDKKFNEETIEEDIKAIKDKLDTADLQLLMGSMIRLTFEDKKLEEMTYAEILEDGKKWKAEQRALAAKAAKAEAEKTKRLNAAVMVSCYEKGFTEYNYEDYITYKFVIKNKSDKQIRAVKGEIIFTNLFDDQISSLNFVYDQPIEAGKEITWNVITAYNEFKDADKVLKNKKLKDLKIVWKPGNIIFGDGTTLE